MDDQAIVGEVTELLQVLIRNRCVTGPDPLQGGESRSVDTLRQYFDGSHVDFEVYEKIPGRASLVGRIEGSDADAPTVLLMGHTDVVPVSEENWRYDPFAAELHDGWVWGRGAVDMLNLTSSMAVAVKQLTMDPIRPRGDVVFLAVADEEAGGRYGAEFLLDEHRDAVQADYVITESGGYHLNSGTGPKLPVTVGEKGFASCHIHVRGVAGHASTPLYSDNAVVTAATVIQRLADYTEEPQFQDAWRQFVAGMEFDEEYRAALLDPVRFDAAIQHLPDGLAPRAHACAHTTFAPTIVHGGVKSNVIPDSVDIHVNIRTLMGQDEQYIRTLLRDVLGDVFDRVDVTFPIFGEATESPTDTPMWDALERSARKFLPDAKCVPTMTAGGTDSYFFRRAGIPAYGFGLFSPQITIGEFFRMFHGDNERIDQESLLLSTKFWLDLARSF